MTPVMIDQIHRPNLAAPTHEDRSVRDYAVLGGVLRSALDFPELEEVEHAQADWKFHVCHSPPPTSDVSPLGEREIGTEFYRLGRSPDGFRLEYSHAGTFDVSADGQEICWYPIADAAVELARAIVLGPALSLALELGGYLCLHGSAVAIDGRAVAFLGPKFHGKSTIATALTAAGAQLISDDVLAVAPGPPPRVRAGVPSIRLWGDAVAELDLERLCRSVITGVKTTASGFAERVMTGADAPLDAIYLLAPVLEVEDGRACWRTGVQGAEAGISLAHQTKLPASLVGLGLAGDQLKTAAAVASSVAIWRLHLVRDFTRLDAAVRQILDWHSGAHELPPGGSER